MDIFKTEFEEVENIEIVPKTKHLCWIYENDDDRLNVAGPYLLSALVKRKQCLLVLPDDVVKKLLEEAVAADVNVARYQETGQLVTLTPEEMFLEKGVLNADLVIDRLQKATDNAQAKGWVGISIVTDPSSVLERSGEKEWLALEFRADYECSSRACTMLCLYDQRRISGAFLTSIIKVHPVIGLGNTLARNPFYVDQPVSAS